MGTWPYACTKMHEIVLPEEYILLYINNKNCHNKAFPQIFRLSRKHPLVSKFVILLRFAHQVASSKLINLSLTIFSENKPTQNEYSLNHAF